MNFKNIDKLGNKYFNNMYRVYDDGRIYSNKRNKFLKPFPDGRRGYLKIKLYDIEGNPSTLSIHSLVMILFNGCAPELMIRPTINHEDGDILNNDKDNLTWLSNDDNIRHAIENNVSNFRKNQLSLDTVHKVCKLLFVDKIGPTETARVLEISQHAVEKISAGNNYKYISEIYKNREER